MKLHLVIAILSLLTALSADAATFGTVTLAGNGCRRKTSEFQNSIPLRLNIEKTSSRIDRKTCNAVLPVKLEADEKLVIEDVSQDISATVEPGGTAKAQLEIFFAGQKSAAFKAETVAKDKALTEAHKLGKTGVVAESACGGDVIVRANASGFAMGTGKVSLHYEDLQIALKAVKCSK